MTAPLYTPFAQTAHGQRERMRHLLRHDGGFPRSVCREASWSVKSADDPALRWCMDCVEPALRAIADTLGVLGVPTAARVILGQLDDDAWDARKALIDRALEADPERPPGAPWGFAPDPDPPLLFCHSCDYQSPRDPSIDPVAHAHAHAEATGHRLGSHR